MIQREEKACVRENRGERSGEDELRAQGSVCW